MHYHLPVVFGIKKIDSDMLTFMDFYVTKLVCVTQSHVLNSQIHQEHPWVEHLKNSSKMEVEALSSV